MPTEQYRTKSGKILTEADLDALADEAERGYDISRLTRRFYPQIIGGKMPDTFTVVIELGNDAMQGGRDVSRALHKIADRVAQGDEDGKIMDDNGNSTGNFWYG